MSKKETEKIMEAMVRDSKVRRSACRQSHTLFFQIYLGHYMIHPPAPFHKELFAITENEEIKNAVIVAFRNSAKSTIMTLSYVLWSILGHQQKKFVLILGHTMNQAKMYLKNIKEELETNELLRKDLGPFREENEWQAQSIIIPKHNARIMVSSFQQSIRGLRYREHRPDLIIADDVEDLSSVATQEMRDKVSDWFTGEIIPAGEQSTRIIVIGNLLHDDCLVMRLKKYIDKGKFNGVFKKYPLINERGEITWPGKFPDMEAVQKAKDDVMDEVTWQREMMLKIISKDSQVIHRDWIHYYDNLPTTQSPDFKYIWTGVDLAISKKSYADYTAIVSAQIHGSGSDLKIYILPNPINEKLTFPETIDRIKHLHQISGNSAWNKIFVEANAYQASVSQHLQTENYPVEGVNVPANTDKRYRLSCTSFLLKNKTILFPKQGAEKLISQMLGFGAEKHDDLVDAFSMLVNKILEENTPVPKITVFSI